MLKDVFLLVYVFTFQGNRRYTPLQQPTAQKVIANKVSEGPITVILIGSLTNFALFMMSNPHLKHNIQHIYVMGGGVRSQYSSSCCPANSTAAECTPIECSGNLFTNIASNPYAEFNIFSDPFAAYQVLYPFQFSHYRGLFVIFLVIGLIIENL